MFAAGRYDPTLADKKEEEKEKDPINRKDVTKRRKVSENESQSDGIASKKIKLVHTKKGDGSAVVSDANAADLVKDMQPMDIDKDTENIDDDSSSCPSSSDDSSSSVPSSEESDQSDMEDDTPALKVIAPEQNIESIDMMRQKIDTTNEGMDDFDHGNDILQDHSDEVKRALKMSNMGIQEAAKIWNLAPFLVENLERDEYKSFFPIQALVIPDVIASERHAHIRNRDVTVSSPTGSGKTLAFVLPVLNSLARRKVRRLRALVVLPSRDLGKFLYITKPQFHY
jgi:ATP-dependent RNA helicase DDX51/DBP6